MYGESECSGSALCGSRGDEDLFTSLECRNHTSLRSNTVTDEGQ